MKIPRSFLLKAQKSLAESIDFRSIIHLAREIIPNYDIYKRKKLPENIPITRIEASKQIITDMYDQNLLMQFLSILISIEVKGIMGRKYKISGLNELMKGIHDLGFIYDTNTSMLLEHPKFRISRNWGVLQHNTEYLMSFLWIDIVGYSKIVKKHGLAQVQKYYDNFLQIVQRSVEKRNGRVWSIEGDGILSAFHFYDKGSLSLYSAIEILYSIEDYNLFSNTTEIDLFARLSVHSGTCVYKENREEQIQCDVIKDCIKLQNKAKKSQIIVSKNIISSIDTSLAKIFKPLTDTQIPEHYIYSVTWK